MRVFAVAFFVLLTACKEQAANSSETQAAEDAETWLAQELSWVEVTTPAERLAQDRAQNINRFLSVCSLGCGVVGISDVTVRVCYPDVAVVVVDKTTEAVQSDRHAALKKQAKTFAETYNRLMAERLKSEGAGACPPPVDWDAAYTEMVGMLERTYTGGFRGDVSVSDQRRAFQIRLPRAVTRDDVHKPLCEIISRHGLRDRATLEVKGVDAQEDYAQLAC